MPASRGSVTVDLLKGIANGIALAFAFLAVGAIRAVILILAGHTLAPLSTKDERMLAFYIGAFAFGGALVGLARPYMTSNRRTYVVYSIAGAAAAIVLTMGFDDRAAWPLWAAGAALGCAMAHGVIRARTMSPDA